MAKSAQLDRRNARVFSVVFIDVFGKVIPEVRMRVV